MYNFDEEVKEVLKKKISKPISYELSIKNAFNKKEKKNLNFSLILKTLAATSCVLILTTGIGLATHIVYEKVWKEPTLVNEQEKSQNALEKVTEEEKQLFISEEKAIEIAKKVMKDLGYDEREIIDVSIYRDYNLENTCHYYLKSASDNEHDFSFNINPITGELEYFSDNKTLYKDIKCDEVSKDYIIETASNIYTKLGILNGDNYEVVKVERQNYMFKNHVNDLWQVSYGKKYDGITNDANIFTISFAICNGKIEIDSLRGKLEEEFKNNPIVISKEEAIQIALNKEKEFSNYEVSNVNAELSIEKMNMFVFCLENNIENKNGEYELDNIPRKVWVVKIEHEKEGRVRDYSLQAVKTMYNKKYFIDATTGEIIGGKETEFFDN